MQIEQAPEEQSIFEDVPERASTGKRLADYLIDLIVFYILLILFGIFIGIVEPGAISYFRSESSGYGLVDRIVTIILYAVYMGAVEALFKGKSLGKLITKTKAVNLDGTPISAGTAFARGFSRAVPFCPFSAFGNPCDPWQDRWTRTMVVNEKNNNYQ